LTGPGVTFALGTFERSAGPFPALVIGEQAADLRRHLGPDATVRRLLEDWDDSLPRLRELARGIDEQAREHPLSDLRALPPVQPPGQVFQAGANYHRHVLELMDGAERRGDESDGLLASADRDEARLAHGRRARDGRPFIFLGSSHSMIGASDDVVLPFDSEQPDWEIELAAVIGRRTRRVGREEALDTVAGYMICNDLTSRDALARSDVRALGLDWLAGKNAPTFLPTGPLLVPAEFIPDPMNLRLRLRVNGQTMQDESTSDMLFDIATLISYISSVAELRPGDLVLTGSPAGNGASHGVFLRPGDVIEAEIDRLGSQRNRCVAEPRAGAQRRKPDTASEIEGTN
jgi:2-keto-4-pentenoate hydratase/2-oxohepta-3-ene-1,7-dioic acid hydratase in catechol pathway